jgi:hypothetical protein
VTGELGSIAAASPASPIRTNFCPWGPTSRTSRLSGSWWYRSYRVTRNAPTCSGPPDTVIVDG